MKKSPINPFTGSSAPAVLVTLCFAASPAFAADYYHLGGDATSLTVAANYSNTNGSAVAATVNPGANPGTGNSVVDNLYFYNSTAGAGPLNKTLYADLSTTLASTIYVNSLTFGSNAGTTQIIRDGTGVSNTVSKIFNIGAGGITVDALAGPVTFGAAGQRVIVGAVADYTVANNSSSALTFAREFDGRGAAPSTVTVAGSGNGDTIFASIKGYDAARDLAMVIDKTSGSGVVRFNGTNNFTSGTTVLAGTLALGHATNTLYDTGVVTVNGAAAILSIAGNSDTVGAVSLKNGGSITGSGGTLTGASYAVESGSVSAKLGGSGALTKSTAGTVTLTGANTYTGATTLTAGTLSVGVTANLGAAAANLVFNGGNLQITGTTLSNFSGIGHAVSFTAAKAVGLDIENASHTFTVDQVLDQTTGGFNKFGAGTAILNQTNTYSGATMINAGTLALGASGTIDNTSEVSLGTVGTFDVSAKSGYTVGNLKGSGSVTGALTVSTTLAIGNSPGTINFSGDLTLAAASTYEYELTGGAFPGLNSADLGDVAGNLTLAGSILDLVQLGTYTANNKFTLFAYDGTLTGTFMDLSSNILTDGATFTDAGGTWMIDYNDTSAGANGGVSASNTYVTITAIPEANVAALIGGFGVLSLLRRRR